MEAFLISTSVVALAEMGDKTQLLSLVLAARFRKPLPIVLGIFVATVVNHALAGAVGAWITSYLGENGERYLAPVTFETKGDADAWLSMRRAELEERRWRPPPVPASPRW